MIELSNHNHKYHEGSYFLMNHSNTRENVSQEGFLSQGHIAVKERTVRGIEPLPLSEFNGFSTYQTPQGENEKFLSVTFLANPPKGGQGRVESMHVTKQQQHIRRAMQRLTRIIRANFTGCQETEAHITLTYQKNMRDSAKLYQDLKEFMRLLRKGYKEHSFEYVAVMEPQKRGAWHIHLLLKSDKPLWLSSRAMGLCFDKVRDMWRSAIGGGGATRHERLPADVDDYGRYFGAYFATEIPEDIELSGCRETIAAASKAAEKGSRLHFYPIGFRFYRCSAGIVRPKASKREFNAENVSKTYGKPKYSAAYLVLDEDEQEIQFIQSMEFREKKA